jgi:hypothetical protein
VHAAIEHRVEALVAWQLRSAMSIDRWPEAVRVPLGDKTRKIALFEAARENELRRVLTALDRAGIGCLLVKGAALAYTCYKQPWLRPRVDNDLFIRDADVPLTRRVFQELSYETSNELTGEYVSQQIPWIRTDRLGLQHVFDVHWKINNRPAFSDLLSFDELEASATDVPRIRARVPSTPYQLILACLHRVTHHRNSDNLLWYYDIHLLAGALNREEFAQLIDVARRKQIAAICAAGLNGARAVLHTAVPDGVMNQLDVTGEPSAAYLRESPWRGDVRLSDLRAVPGWRRKIQYIRAVAVPSADFMLKEYRCTSRALVPALHVHRLARGTWRLFRRFTSEYHSASEAVADQSAESI